MHAWDVISEDGRPIGLLDAPEHLPHAAALGSSSSAASGNALAPKLVAGDDALTEAELEALGETPSAVDFDAEDLDAIDAQLAELQ